MNTTAPVQHPAGPASATDGFPSVPNTTLSAKQATAGDSHTEKGH